MLLLDALEPQGLEYSVHDERGKPPKLALEILVPVSYHHLSYLDFLVVDVDPTQGLVSTYIGSMSSVLFRNVGTSSCGMWSLLHLFSGFGGTPSPCKPYCAIIRARCSRDGHQAARVA